ncbi:MAG TPA: bifunctional 5,10-methylenetetrahydrofolate dehydrogenase/5,10-methenyltetrahydrofolate cyclohydrolase [Pseudothermotoga sp.]|uniref:bifunctional 5,10-methylenetetrahydrofolate dehydrogenase/5,10-methenyltetrahydrofolate cyclohydrolase n=1 Tax=Thermotoga profunda TaxID=1508420 RepID=UPI00059729E6|nr:bifunctional 5,10-methylenetetrahydrofolate dehydrogenase/5,10-methenyltetrahydrofolate cyclohydrolase [Thermotoga profunda]
MLIDCKSIAQSIDSETLSFVQKSLVKPKLVSITVKPDQSTISYLRSQQKKAQSLGIDFEIIDLEDNSLLEKSLIKVSQDKSIHGIFVAHPLPAGVDEMRIAELIKADKDIEGRNPLNLGYLAYGIEDFAPCTAMAVVTILSSVTNLVGKNVVIIGRSTTVGLPVSIMLLRRDRSATVIVCHSKTKDIPSITKRADVIVVAVGKAGFLTPEMVCDGSVVIDVGINVVDGKIFGDVDKSVQEKAHVTPVPGGVGIVTTSILMNRVAKNAFRGDMT